MVAQLEKTRTQEDVPIDRFLSLLRGYTVYTSMTHHNRGYIANCPGSSHRNGDSKPSLMVWEDENGAVGLKCHAGCSHQDICEALGITVQDLYPQNGKYKPKQVARKLDLVDLARDKCIDPRLLTALGITDGHTYTNAKGRAIKNVVRIPYFALDGTEYSRAHIRLATKGHGPWEGKGELIPYGLNRLQDATDYLVIPEGESDCWTLWQWNVASLGIPGATNAQCLLEEHVQLFPRRVYIVKEPSEPGKPPAGEMFVKSVAARLHTYGYQGEVYQLDLQASHNLKDPNDLNKLLFSESRPQDFPTEWQKALDGAEKLDMGDKAICLPEIIIGGQLRDVSQDALAALHDEERADPTIFVKAGKLVQLIRDEKRNPVIRPMSVPEVRNALTRTGNYYRAKTLVSSDEVKLVPISPPKEIAENILAMDPTNWPFPALVGLVEMPIMRSDGSILDTPGYDSATGLYYACTRGMESCKIPKNPTREQMFQAVSLINACIREFPYETAADYANMFGLLLTLVTRYMYEGDVMTALINATKQGTGKSLLAQFAAILATGRPPAMTTFPEKEEETKKVIDSKVLASVPLIVFDNIKRTFQSASLDMLTTCRGWYSVRPLGKTQDISVYTQVTVIGTGNNLQLDTDQARRCYQIRLVSPVSNPDERTDITIKNLVEYAIEHRAQLVAALLTLARAWYAAGKPDATNKLARSASSYRQWCNTVGGILEYAGIADFQGNRDTFRAEANMEEQQIDLFLHAWVREFGNDYIPAVRAVKLIKNASLAEEDAETHPLYETLPDYLKNAFFERERSVQSCTVAFAIWLSKRVKTAYGTDNIRIEYREDTVKCQKMWRVVILGGNDSDPGPDLPPNAEAPGSAKKIEESGDIITVSASCEENDTDKVEQRALLEDNVDQENSSTSLPPASRVQPHEIVVATQEESVINGGNAPQDHQPISNERPENPSAKEGIHLQAPTETSSVFSQNGPLNTPPANSSGTVWEIEI